MTGSTQTEKVKDLYLNGTIATTTFGYQKLMLFYTQASAYTDTVVNIHFNRLDWIDPNMTAIFQGVLFKLNKKNNLIFVAQLPPNHKLNILFSNGFFNPKGYNVNYTGTAIRLKEFYKDQQDDFVNYVENDLLDHNGLTLSEDSKEIIIGSMIEIYSNFEIHSHSENPMFVCGQYYPKKGVLKFTIFDLGIGFLKPIQKKYEEIKTYCEAISWALIRGNTTKDLTIPGGCGLSDLKEDMLTNNGQLEIISGNAYKKCFNQNGKVFEINNKLEQFNIGTCINLFFKEF